MSARQITLGWWRPLAGVLLLAGVGCVVWGLASYVSLTRLEVRVVDASDRVEAASRSREELATNVIHASSNLDWMSAETLAGLQRAVARAGETPLFPGVLRDPERHSEFLSAQEELTRALEQTWAALQSREDEGTLALVGDLQDSVQEVENLLLERLGDLEACVDVYRSRSEGFPRSVIAGMVTGSGAAAEPPQVAATPERAAASAPGPG